MGPLSLLQALAVLLCLVPADLAFRGPNPYHTWLSPEYHWLYEFPLPIPPIKEEKWPSRPINNPITGKKVKYYEVEIKQFTQQIYPNLEPTTLIGYDGMSPGPMFYEEKGMECVVRFTNHARLASSAHLHGSYSRSPFDGWAEDLTQPGQYKDYFYPNLQSARMIWYHDHAIGHTAENAYFGQAGAYIIHDADEDALGLPSGYGKYDIPLILASKQYNSDGSLFSPANEDDSLYGDIFDVNGQPWPYFKVEPRRYRLRFLNQAISRSFLLYFEIDSGDKTGQELDFDVIASDSGLLTQPVQANELFIAMGERYEVVMDFSQWRGQNITLRNALDFAPQREYSHTDEVMRFVVGSGPTDDSSKVPSKLRDLQWPTAKGGGKGRNFVFEHIDGQWRINGINFMDVQNRVLARPDRGLVETWQLENRAGGSSHPVHLHLVDFRVLDRTGGPWGVHPYESAGLKDVVWLGPGEKVTLEAHYSPWPGVYMFHCHNLIHEDHMMMAAFNVSTIADLGYNETNYVDPMEEAYRPRKAEADEYAYDAVRDRMEVMCGYQPYDDAYKVDGWLSSYWATKTANAGGADSSAEPGPGHTGPPQGPPQQGPPQQGPPQQGPPQVGPPQHQITSAPAPPPPPQPAPEPPRWSVAPEGFRTSKRAPGQRPRFAGNLTGNPTGVGGV